MYSTRGSYKLVSERQTLVRQKRKETSMIRKKHPRLDWYSKRFREPQE